LSTFWIKMVQTEAESKEKHGIIAMYIILIHMCKNCAWL
jgi:hypothetical protein